MNRRELSIDWYLERAISLLKMSPLETQYQSYIVYPILEEILQTENRDCDLVDCHNFRQFNTNNHDRTKYSVLAKAVPDLLIAKNFFFNNKDKHVYDALESIVAVEVKEPNSSAMLDRVISIEKASEEITSNNHSVKEYSDGLYTEILPNLVKNGKLILTNIRKWETFDVSEVKDDKLRKQINNYLNELTNVANKYNNANERKKISEEVKKLDKENLTSIKKFVQASHVSTWNIINNKGKLVVNRDLYGEDIEKGISGVSNMDYEFEAYKGLKNGLRSFLFPEDSPE